MQVVTCVGGVRSPLLANLFLHYAFDAWMQREFPGVQFERYADDAIVHCRSERQAQSVLEAIRGRFTQCGLELHPTKTQIVYCKDADRRGVYERVAFDFLGYTFQPRRAKNRAGKFFVSFLPAMSTKAATRIRATIRAWRMASSRNNQRLEDLANLVNPSVRGWMNYYGRFYRSKCVQTLRHLNKALAAWAQRKFKRLRRRERASMHWLGGIAQREPNLPEGDVTSMNFGSGGNTEAKAWKDIWGSGQGIGAVKAVESVADRVDRLEAEYNTARTELAAKARMALA